MTMLISKHRTWILLAGALAVLAFGGVKAPAVAADAKEITLAMPEEPETLAGWSAKTSQSNTILRNIEESLLNRDPVTNELVGELATSWSMEEPTRWRFILRQGVKFQDGSPFNAEAAAFTLTRLWDPKTVTILTSFLGPKMTFTAVDDYTLDVTTEKPDPLVPARLYVSPISSMVAYKADPKADETHPVGTGPYSLTTWDRGQRIVLDKNPDWWGLNSPDAHGKITFDKVTWVFRKESSVRTDMVINGEAGFARWISADDCKKEPSCDDASSVETLLLRPDIANPVLGDFRVREAIAMAIDKQQLLDVVVGGGQASGQMVGPSATGYNPDLKPTPFDLDKATALIGEARAAGVPIDSTTITLLAQPGLTTATDQTVEVLVAALQAIGLKVQSRIEDHAIYIQEVTAKPIPPERGNLILARHGNDLMDYSLTVNAYFRCDGAQSGYCDPKMEDMAKKLDGMSATDRVKALQDIAVYAQQQLATIVIGQLFVHFGVGKDIVWKPRLDGLILLKEMSLAS